jgi:hypothetical protein
MINNLNNYYNGKYHINLNKNNNKYSEINNNNYLEIIYLIILIWVN